MTESDSAVAAAGSRRAIHFAPQELLEGAHGRAYRLDAVTVFYLVRSPWRVDVDGSQCWTAFVYIDGRAAWSGQAAEVVDVQRRAVEHVYGRGRAFSCIPPSALP